MKLFDRFRRNSPPPSLAPEIDVVRVSAHDAIQEARAGRLSIGEMLSCLAEGSLVVPLAAPPKMAGQAVVAWEPCTISKPDGSQWLAAFTEQELASEFGKQAPAYSYGMSIGTRWLLDVLPPDHGIVINVGTTEGFEWSAAGIAEYKARVPRHAP
jgi:hypothetical protein